jgi:hypothetical protein
VHTHPATSSLQIAETIHFLFTQHVDEHRLYHRVGAALKKQIIQTLPHHHLQILEGDDFGFADVSPLSMLQHLQTTHGQILPDDLEKNRNLLSSHWNPNNPIEEVWIQIQSCQAFAAPFEPITNNAAIRLTLTAFEKTGVFASAVNKWHNKPAADHTLPIFIAHFNFKNKERLRKLTARTAGHHGAHQATVIPTPLLLLLLMLMLHLRSKPTTSSCVIVIRMG